MAIGREASSYQIEVNGEVVARDITGKKYRLELSKLPAGILTIRLVGNDTKTNFELLFDKESTRLKEPVPASCLVRVKHRK